MDRLTSLTVFARVVECGGFSAAARRLNMSVAMVSNHVQALEDKLGTRLLNRTTRKVGLTEIGREYYQRSSHILADLEEADRFASSQQVKPRGVLRLHASTNIARFLSPVVASYLDAHPEVSIDLTAGEQMVDMIENGYDLVIHTAPPPNSRLIVRRLTSWRHVLCCAPAYLQRHPAPRDLADLKRHNCLRFAYYPFGEDWRFDGPDGKPVPVHSRGNLVTGSAELLRLLAVAGNGILLAPDFFIADELAAGTLVQLLPHQPTTELTINAIYPSRHHLSSKVRVFIDLLTSRFQTRALTSSKSIAPSRDHDSE